MSRGTRVHPDASITAAPPLGRRWSGKAFNLLLRGLGLARISDTQCGLRAFTAAAYPIIRWQAADYSVETEMLIRAARGHLRIAQIEIDVVYHDRYKGTTIGDGVKIFGDMLRLSVSR